MGDTIRVKYSFSCRAKFTGEMEIPRGMFERVAPDEEWSDEIEQYIADRHDGANNPPDTFPEHDADFDYVERTPGTESEY